MSGFLDRERFKRDHRWAPGRMSDYLDGGLAARGRARLDHHLAECDECRRLLAGLRRTGGPPASPGRLRWRRGRGADCRFVGVRIRELD